MGPRKVPLSEATKGRVDSLTHDTTYFDAINKASIHGGVLSDCASTTSAGESPARSRQTAESDGGS
jgi:hypothetical protein